MTAKVLQFRRPAPLTIQQVTAKVRTDIRAAARDGKLPGSWRDYSVTCHVAGYTIPVLDVKVRGWPPERVWRLPGVLHYRNHTDEAREVQRVLESMVWAGREHARAFDCYISFDSDPWKGHERRFLDEWRWNPGAERPS